MTEGFSQRELDYGVKRGFSRFNYLCSRSHCRFACFRASSSPYNQYYFELRLKFISSMYLYLSQIKDAIDLRLERRGYHVPVEMKDKHREKPVEMVFN